MIANFLRPPAGFGELVADGLRALGLLSVLVAAVFFEPTDSGILAFTFPGLLLPRFAGMRASADIGFSVTLLVAAWSNVLDVYAALPWWDIPIHFAGTAFLAATVYLLLGHWRIVRPADAVDNFPASVVVITLTIGLALSAVWELVEWVGFAFITSDIVVEYADTIGDMAMGGLGALCAGFAVAYLPLTRKQSTVEPISAE